VDLTIPASVAYAKSPHGRKSTSAEEGAWAGSPHRARTGAGYLGWEPFV